MKKVLVLLNPDEKRKAALESAAPDCRFLYHRPGEETEEEEYVKWLLYSRGDYEIVYI